MKQKIAKYINDNTDEKSEIRGYLISKPFYILSWILFIATLGFLRLVFYWKPEWMLYFTHSKSELQNASSVLITDKYKQNFVEKIRSTRMQNSKYFMNKKVKYVWNNEMQNFEKLKGLEHNTPVNYFTKCTGLTEKEQAEKRLIYGENSIRLHLTPLYVLFFRDVFSPFYIFQVFSCALWYNDDYYYYASVIILLSIISIIYSLYSIRRNERALRDIVHHASKVTLFRKDPNTNELVEVEVNSEDIVPGDLISVKNMSLMQCDAVLLNGNVIVNESMLTGEFFVIFIFLFYFYGRLEI